MKDIPEARSGIKLPRRDDAILVTAACSSCRAVLFVTLPYFSVPRGDVKMSVGTLIGEKGELIKERDKLTKEADRGKPGAGDIFSLEQLIDGKDNANFLALLKEAGYGGEASLSKIVSLINCPICKKAKLAYRADSKNAPADPSMEYKIK